MSSKSAHVALSAPVESIVEMRSAGAKIIPLKVADDEPVSTLTARMAAAEEEAFNEFHELYCDRLYRYLLVLCKGDEAHARDLLQVTMLKVVRAIRVFESEDRFWNWLAAIARNSFLDHVRKSRRAPELRSISRDDVADLALPQISDVDAALVNALEHGLGDLPADERALLESFYFQSATYRSLAVEQEASEKAIESRLARARQKLKHAITKYLTHENT
jgi:RNA polymerase sigma factor (sigma-70 family)